MIVIVVDESGTCDVAATIFTIDVTPSIEGDLRLQHSVDLVNVVLWAQDKEIPYVKRSLVYNNNLRYAYNL